MKLVYIFICYCFLISGISACNHLNYDSYSEYSKFMGKNSKFYDAYKQGKCVLDNALKGMPVQQRKVLANLIAKSYLFEN